MIVKIGGKQTFCYGSSLIKTKRYYYRYVGSLLGILMGIFLIPQIAYFSDISNEKLIELTNEERILNGLDRLSANQLLTSAAYKKAESILNEQKFAHNFGDRRFSEWIKDTDYKYSYIGENLAIDFVTSEGVIQGWINSPTHKDNLLNPIYKEIGIAVVERNFQGENTVLVVQIFGAPPATLIQPKVLGISNNNYLTNSNSVISSERLLTHSISNNYKNIITNNFIINKNLLNTNNSFINQSINYVNTFFVQHNNKTIIDISLYLLITILSCGITYAYVISFTKLKIKN